MFWRVFGPAWTRSEIDYQLDLMRNAGIGGVTLFLMYPVALDSQDFHNQRFLSAEFLDTLGYAARRAHELGLRFAVAGGTGWPFGGPSVSAPDSAQRLKAIMLPGPAKDQSIHLPALGPDEKYIAVFCGTNVWTTAIGFDGVINGVPSGPDAWQAFVTGPTRMQVKRPALGGEGLVLDHYQAENARRYLERVVGPMLEAAPGLVESVFCDSLEVYGANWTADLPKAFLRRRGYSLIAHLPELFDAIAPNSPDVRYDFWRTLAELTEERFTRAAFDWAHSHHVKFEMEAYGTPPNPLTAARYIDLPTGEQYEWKGFSLSRLAASGAHLAARRIIGAEAWTWLGLPNRLGDSLSDLKLASDLHFLAGINDLTGVDFAYSPRSAGTPGWMPYYGPVFNQNNPQWPWFRDLLDYTSRCQWLLRQGSPVADVAIYLPVEDQFAFGPVDQMLLDFQLRDHFVSGEKTGEFGLAAALRHHSDLIAGLLRNGWNYDGIDFFGMDRTARAVRGKLEAGDGRYSILILPNVRGIELEALAKVVAFCRSGGRVIATRRLPERMYGLGRPSDRVRFVSLLNDLFGPEQERTLPWTHACGRGVAYFVPDDVNVGSLALADLQPDAGLEPLQTEVGFVHRQDGRRDYYFMANTGERAVSFVANLRASGRRASLWDPQTGEIHGCRTSAGSGKSLAVPLELPARGSCFVVVDSRGAEAEPEAKPVVKSTIELNLDWKVALEGTDAPPTRVVHKLQSWSQWPDARFYSGIATYSAEFNWDRPVAKHVWIALSKVHEVARVSINGQIAGDAWIPPYEVEVGRLLRPGTNSLSITVGNLPLNRFLGAPEPDLKSLRGVYGNRFPEPEEKRIVREPISSGLLGPVQLIIGE
jgi:hypothetical protein